MSNVPDVTHKEIYDRLIAVETKVDTIQTDTKDVVAAFVSARGAFVVLEMIGKIAKPILWVAGLCSAFAILYAEWRK